MKTLEKVFQPNLIFRYVIIWEKGGTLQEATIITDGVAQDATGGDEQVTSVGADRPTEDVSAMIIDVDKEQPNANQAMGKAMDVSGQPPVDATRTNLTGAAAGATFITEDGTPVDPSQLQLIDEHGNPIHGLTMEQLSMLSEGAVQVQVS